jgi:hypothetical protein
VSKIDGAQLWLAVIRGQDTVGSLREIAAPLTGEPHVLVTSAATAIEQTMETLMGRLATSGAINDQEGSEQ